MPTAINNNTRISITPLSIEHIRLAKDKELLCDYARGTLYIKYKDKLMNITDKLKEILIRDGMNLDYCPITIEGMGTINLSVALSHIMNNLVTVTDLGSEPGQIISGYDIDYITLTNKYKKLQIVGFRDAPEGSVPMKVGGLLVWKNINGAIPDDDEEIGGNADMVETITVGANGVVQMVQKSVQHTNNLNETNSILEVKMPNNIETQYYMFKWRLDTANYDSSVTFPSSVGFEYDDDDKIEPNSIYVYTFETWDWGQTWFAKRMQYNKPEYAETILNAISPRIYTRDQIDTLLSWIDGDGNASIIEEEDHTTEG